MNEQGHVLKGKLCLVAGSAWPYPSLASGDLLITSPSSLACVENNQRMGAGTGVRREQPQLQAAGAECGEPPGWRCSWYAPLRDGPMLH